MASLATRPCAASSSRCSRAVRCFASAAAGPSATTKPRALAQKLQQLAVGAVTAGALLSASGPALAADGVRFTSPANGTSVSGPVHVELAVQGMTVKPAAAGLVPGTGHYHLYIDVPPSEQQGEGEAIPFDKQHVHFGKGQTAGDLELAPGKHTLTLQFANALHESYGSKWASPPLVVNVE